MMKKWNVLYYETANGECYVEKFIEKLTKREQAKILAIINELQNKGINLPRPFADLLRDGIHELRIKLSGEQTRTLYFFCYKDFIVLTHSFVKNTSAVPDKEIERAIRIRNDFLVRYNDKTLKDLL